MFERKLQTNHRTFIATQMAEFTHSPSKIQAMLADPEKGKEYGFDPVDVGAGWLSMLINKDEDIKSMALQLQVRYLMDYSKVRLAHKKERVLELIKLFDSVDSMKKGTGEKRKDLSDLQKFDKKRQILAQLANETDESLGNLAEAIKDSTSQTQTLHETLLGYFKAPDDKAGFEETQAQVH